MSPWTVLEWVTSVGLAVLVGVAVIALVAVGVKYIFNRGNKKGE